MLQEKSSLGSGVVGSVKPSHGYAQRLVCAIDDWLPFDEPLYFKDNSGNYYEPVSKPIGFYWQVGVRRIEDAVFERIVRAGTARQQL